MSEITLKINFNGDIRRINIIENYEILYNKIKELYCIPSFQNIILSYKDEDSKNNNNNYS